MIELKITSIPIITADCIERITSPECGGINVFIGTVRSHTRGRKVERLEFECYEKMALKELQKIADDIANDYSPINILIHHRTGILQPKEIAVLIAIATPHRDAAIKACRYAIDTLKETVPIWKKEIFEDGEEWVSARP